MIPKMNICFICLITQTQGKDNAASYMNDERNFQTFLYKFYCICSDDTYS